jgi:hypothetical protein
MHRDFQNFQNYFSIEKLIELVHDPMNQVHGIPAYRSMNYIKLRPFKLRWRAQMNRRETLSSALIWAVDVKMNGEGDSSATGGGALL